MNTNLTTFDTMTSDLRGDRGWGLIKHFIIEPHRLTTRAGYADILGAADGITQFTIGKWTDGEWYVFGWGVNGSDSGWHRYDPLNPGWSTPSSSSGNVGTRYDPIAFYFEGNFYAYGYANLSKWIPGTSFDATWYASGYLKGSSWTSIAKPVIVGPNAYFAMDNKVYELATGGTSLTNKYTLSTDRLITSISASGANLSVMTYHTGERKSREFLYNVAGSDTNAFESIDWGSGKILHHQEVRGVVLAIVDERTNISGDANDSSIKLKRRSGNQIVKDAEIKCQLAYSVGPASLLFDDKLCAKVRYITIDGETVSGILSYNTSGHWVIEHTLEFDTTAPNHGFIQVDNSWWVAHSKSGTDVTTRVTGPAYVDVTGYLDGVLQTRMVDHGDRMQSKSLVGASVAFEPLGASSYVKLYYKRPDDADWTLLDTVSTEDATRLSFSNVRGTVPNYREIQFQVKAKNATITGFKETSTLVKDEPYDTK